MANASNKHSALKIDQINLGRAKAATDLLVKTAIRGKYDALLIQESYTFRGKIVGFPMGARIVAGHEADKRAAIVILNTYLGVTGPSQILRTHAVTAEDTC